MKKIFFFIAAMVVVMTANAAIINGTPNGEERGRVNWWVNGEGQAQAGDTIVLADGVYYESTLTIEKDVVIMAAEGAKPEINIARVYGCVKLAGPASVTFDGITFNGNDSVKYMIAVTGADVKKLTVNNCEFKNWTYWAISNQFEKGASIDSVIVENSVFHDGLGSAVHFSEDAPVGKHACNYLKVANSTLYNITSTEYAAIIQANSNGQAEGEQNEIIIDHITLYNFDASQLGAIAMRKSSKLTISNSIIATPENKDQYAFYIYGGNVNNTLYFNGKAKSGPTYTDCLTEDPLFVDAANGNFALKEGSPALTAATDGGAIGDPRWAPVVEEPEPLFYNVTVTGATASVNGQNIDINAQWNEQSMLIRLWQGGATQGFGTYAAEDYGPIMLGGGMKEWTPTTEGVYADNGDGTFTFTCSATDGTTQYNITVTGNNPTQGGGDEVYQIIDDAITNLTFNLDEEPYSCMGGPSETYGIELYLVLGEEDGMGTFTLTEASEIYVQGSPATFISGNLTDIDPSAPAANAVIVATLPDGSTFEFHIAMSSTPVDATVIVVENATLAIDSSFLFNNPISGDVYEYSLTMSGNWTDSTNTTYLVTVEFPFYDPATTEEQERLANIKVGDFAADDAPYLGMVEDYLMINNVNGVITAKGLVSGNGLAFDITISGSLAQGPSTGVENLNGTVAPVKVIENGQIFIIRNGVKYNAQGAKL